ncbi:MAG: FAD-dependent oxidoreductase [Melioribacteraceae bacterium]|nr:FAD-dependent oxidoreductase [Melioribacteraceae bacterium]
MYRQLYSKNLILSIQNKIIYLFATEQKIIVVGGNAAGPSAAAKAKRTAPDAEVILFEAGSFISTGTCELPYLLSHVIDDYKKLVFFSPEQFYSEKGVKVYTQHFVESIDRKSKSITVINQNDGSRYNYEYDKLILSTGAVARRLPGKPENVSNLFTLKSVSDYLRISAYLKSHQAKNVVIFGAGYIGIETAENLRSAGYSVTILEKADLPLPSGEIEISNLIKHKLEETGIEFIGGILTYKFNVRNGKIYSVNIDGRIIDSDMIISAVGFKPNNQLAISAGLKTGERGGIAVNNKLQTSDTDIYAAGDCIEIQNFVTNRTDYIPLATLAHSQGHIAGANASGSNEFFHPAVKNIAVKIFDNVYSSVGINSDEAKRNEIHFEEVHTLAPNLVKVMPRSKKTFGKLIFEKSSKRILGAEFFGYSEVVGYADLIAALILRKETVEFLTRINFNYTPPNSPFINILSILGRKALNK